MNLSKSIGILLTALSDSVYSTARSSCPGLLDQSPPSISLVNPGITRVKLQRPMARVSPIHIVSISGSLSASATLNSLHLLLIGSKLDSISVLHGAGAIQSLMR